MFRSRKTAETDVKKAIQKVLDNRKDNITRLKHLKIILESDPKEAKALFEDNSSLVFYIFYDVFINVESDLKQRVNRAHKEELDTVLFVFEKVFLLVPDLIHRRWQYNCIGRLIRKLLHPNNSIKIRREGVRLFLIWYQILNENANEECHELFSRLVPRLSPAPRGSSNPGSSGSVGVGGSSRVSTAPVSRQSHSRQGSGTLAAMVATSHDSVVPVDISPILPPQGHAEEVCEDYTLEFLHTLLQRLVSEVVNIEWPEDDKPTRRRQALHFLLEQFKRFYLPVLFPPVPSQKSSIYEDCVLYPGGPNNVSILNRLTSEREGLIVNDIPGKKLILYQEEVIRWLAEFVYVGNKSSLNSNSNTGMTSGPQQVNSHLTKSVPIPSLPQQLSEQDADVGASVIDVSSVSPGIGGGHEMGSFPSGSGVGGETGNIPSGDAGGGAGPGVHGAGGVGGSGGAGNGQAPILREPEFPMGAALTAEHVELLRSVLYATRENVLLIHELFSRTLSQFASMQHRAVSCIVTVYREWIRQAVKGHRPAFMREPVPTEGDGDPAQDLVKGCGDDEVFQGNDSADQSVETEDDTVRDSDTDGSSMHTPSETSPAHRPEPTTQESESCRSPSPDLSAVQTAAVASWLSSGQVAAGLQRCLQVIFTSSAHVFVLRSSTAAQYGVNPATDVTSEFLKSHEIICKMVLWFYRHATIQLTLSADTWEKLLMVLLRIVWEVMSSTSPEDTNSLGSLLAGPLFQTLIVTFVKANLHIRVSRELWDKFMSVLSSLTHWPQLIVEWSKTMSTLTRLLAKHVYGLDLRDLPLDRPNKARFRRQNMLSRGQHVSSGSGGSGGINLTIKSRSHDRNLNSKGRGLHRIQAYEHPNLQLADSFSCVKLEDDTTTAHGSSFPAHGHSIPGVGGTGVAATSTQGPRSVSGGLVGSNVAGNNSGGHPSPSPSSNSARASSRSSVDPSGGGGIGEEIQPLLHSSSSSVGGTGGHNTLSSVASISATVSGGAGGGLCTGSIEHDRVSQTSSTSDRQSGGIFGVGGGGGGGDDTSSYASATEDATSYGTTSNTGMPVPVASGSSGATECSRGGGQFDYQQLSTSTNTTHGDSSSGCNVSLGFSDTELLSSSLIHTGGSRHPASDLSVSEETDSSVESDMSSDNEVDCSAQRNEQTRMMITQRRVQQRQRLRQRRKPKNGKGGKGGTLTRDDVTGTALSEEEEVDVEHKEEEEDEDEEAEEDGRDAEEEDEDDDDEETANGHSNSHTIKSQLNERSVVSCSAERINSEDPELLSVMAGGRAVGWTAENCVVLWRRILCCLGDINAIADPNILRTVYDHLSDIMLSLINLRRNLGVSLDNVTTPAPPVLIPPLFFMVPWFFNTLQLPHSYKQAKLIAMRLLCRITVSRHDVELPIEHIAQFHRQLHFTLTNDPDQDIVNEILLNCGPNFFSLSIPGSCLLLLNFIEAAGGQFLSSDRYAPRVEAVSILGSLLSYPTHYRLQGQASVTVLRPSTGASDRNGSSRGLQLTTVPWTEIKDCVVERLIRWGCREPAGSGNAKAVALSSLGIFVYEELASYPGRTWKLHPRVKDAMTTLYQALRFSEKQVACDMLALLVDHVELLLHELPDLPLKVVEQCSHALQSLMSERRDTSKSEKRLIVSLIFCLVEWCMHLPLSLLLDSTDSHSKGLIFLVVRVLHCVARGGTHVTPWKSAFSAMLPQSQVGAASDLDWHNFHHLDQISQLSASQLESSLSTGRASMDGSNLGSPSLATSPSSDSHAGDGSSTASQAGILATSESAGGSTRTLRSPKLSSKDGLEMVRLAARTALSHLLNHLGQFPVTSAAVLDSFVQEWQEVDLLGLDAPLSDLTPGLFDAPNLQMFTVNDSALLSLLTLPERRPDGDAEDGLVDGDTLVRAIVRDVGGKYCWDARVLYGSSAQTPLRVGSADQKSVSTSTVTPKRTQGVDDGGGAGEEEGSGDELLHADQLRELLASLEKSSPELSLQPPSKPAPSLDEASAALEDVAKQQLHAEEMWEDQTLLRLDSDPKSNPRGSLEDDSNGSYMSPFYVCRHVLSQLGFFAWERRPHIDLLKKKDNLLLELKNLDMRSCRETHKIAVIYVGPGQEDKQTILSNATGSRGFEDFVAGLGWEVVLDRHPGFRGGLDCSGRTGLTTPYYATSTLEVIFHVATRMPSVTEEDRHRKLKHLGNDEIWLVWSEHERDFRRGLIPTEFGDVLIVVYPLADRAGLLRVSIDRKPEIPFFGPLFDGVVVSDRVLPGLVRATAINASRVNRALKQGYLTFYEERARCLDDIIQKYKKSTTFESFARHCFAPILLDDGVVPNSPTDHADGHTRTTGVMRAIGEQTCTAAGSGDKREGGKPKVRFPEQMFFGEDFGQISSDVVLRSHNPVTNESDSKPASIVRRLSMKTKRTILHGQANLKRQSSPSYSPSHSPQAYGASATSPRQKASSPTSKDSS